MGLVLVDHIVLLLAGNIVPYRIVCTAHSWGHELNNNCNCMNKYSNNSAYGCSVYINILRILTCLHMLLLISVSF